MPEQHSHARVPSSVREQLDNTMVAFRFSHPHASVEQAETTLRNAVPLFSSFSRAVFRDAYRRAAPANNRLVIAHNARMARAGVNVPDPSSFTAPRPDRDLIISEFNVGRQDLEKLIPSQPSAPSESSQTSQASNSSAHVQSSASNNTNNSASASSQLGQSHSSLKQIPPPSLRIRDLAIHLNYTKQSIKGRLVEKPIPQRNNILALLEDEYGDVIRVLFMNLLPPNINLRTRLAVADAMLAPGTPIAIIEPVCLPYVIHHTINEATRINLENICIRVDNPMRIVWIDSSQLSRTVLSDNPHPVPNGIPRPMPVDASRDIHLRSSSNRIEPDALIKTLAYFIGGSSLCSLLSKISSMYAKLNQHANAIRFAVACIAIRPDFTPFIMIATSMTSLGFIDASVWCARRAFAFRDQGYGSLLVDELGKILPQSLLSDEEGYLAALRAILSIGPFDSTIKRHSATQDMSILETSTSWSSNLQSKGDAQLKNSKYLEALNLYIEALSFLDSPELCAMVLSNRSASRYKAKRYRQAIVDAFAAVLLDPSRLRSWCRLILAIVGLCWYSEAITIINMAIVHFPGDKALLTLQKRLGQLQAQKKESNPNGKTVDKAVHSKSNAAAAAAKEKSQIDTGMGGKVDTSQLMLNKLIQRLVNITPESDILRAQSSITTETYQQLTDAITSKIVDTDAATPSYDTMQPLSASSLTQNHQSKVESPQRSTEIDARDMQDNQGSSQQQTQELDQDWSANQTSAQSVPEQHTSSGKSLAEDAVGDQSLHDRDDLEAGDFDDDHDVDHIDELQDPVLDHNETRESTTNGEAADEWHRSFDSLSRVASSSIEDVSNQSSHNSSVALETPPTTPYELRDRSATSDESLNEAQFVLWRDSLPKQIKFEARNRIFQFHLEFATRGVLPLSCDFDACMSFLSSAFDKAHAVDRYELAWATFDRPRVKQQFLSLPNPRPRLNVPLVKHFASSVAGTTNFAMRGERNTKVFHSFAPVPCYYHRLFFSHTHVSVEFCDLGEMLSRDLQPNESAPAPLNWLGIDSSPYVVAKNLVLVEMIQQRVLADALVQVWFSSTWSTRTRSSFVAALEAVIARNDQPAEVEAILRWWNVNGNVTLEQAYQSWLPSMTPELWATVADLKEEVDRLAFCTYLLTGEVLKSQVGSTVMFSNPPEVGQRARDECFLRTVDPAALWNCRRNGAPDLITAAVAILYHRLTKLCDEVANNRIKLKVQYGNLFGDSAAAEAVVRTICALHPSDISWGNICDYLNPLEFHSLANRCSSAQSTMHFLYPRLWARDVIGTYARDYIGVKREARMSMLRSSHAKIIDIYNRRQINDFLISPPIRDVHVIIDYFLHTAYHKQWAEAFMDMARSPELLCRVDSIMFDFTIFGVDNELIYLTFAYKRTR